MPEGLQGGKVYRVVSPYMVHRASGVALLHKYDFNAELQQ